MKKVITGILLLFLFTNFSDISIQPIMAEETLEIEVPDNINLQEETVTFTIYLKSELKDNQKVKVSYPKNNYLKGEDEEIPLTIQTNRNAFTNKEKEITFTITHEPITGDYSCDFELKFQLITEGVQKKEETITKEETSVQEEASASAPVNNDVITTERKTFYGLKTVKEWSSSNYSLEIPSGPYNTATQYASETAEFSDAYSLAIPEDGIYEEAIQYGKNTRTKTKKETTELVVNSYHYNSPGACPIDCMAGTINDYGTGCECTICNYEEVTKTTYVYGKWKTDESSFRFNEPYEESDTVEPITRTVYKTPVSFSSNEDWSFEEKTPNSNTRIITRTVYLLPAAYNEPTTWSIEKPDESEGIIVAKERCRLVINGVPQEWKDCE